VGTEDPSRVGAVVLAAGEAKRFGRQKLTVPFRDTTIIGSVVSALEKAGMGPIVVVAGPRGAEISRALCGSRAKIVTNPAPERGMLSSVQTGVSALPEEVQRFLVVLGDQPRIRPADLAHLLETQERHGKGIAIPTYEGKRGHPVALHRCYREAILGCDERKTLRDVIHSHPDDIVDVEMPTDAVTRDIDTQEQYQDELRRSLTEQ
jgi:molybdenum cofactor cytidylyltransferase